MLQVPVRRDHLLPRFLAVAVPALLLAACAPGWWGPLPHDRRAIVERFTQWQQALAEERLEDAYAFMSPDYRAHFPLGRFGEDFSGFGVEYMKVQPDCYVRGGFQTAHSYPYHLEFFDLMNGPEFEWEKVGDTWYLTGEYERYIH